MVSWGLLRMEVGHKTTHQIELIIVTDGNNGSFIIDVYVCVYLQLLCNSQSGSLLFWTVCVAPGSKF